jgi:hypothetical protein
MRFSWVFNMLTWHCINEKRDSKSFMEVIKSFMTIKLFCIISKIWMCSKLRLQTPVKLTLDDIPSTKVLFLIVLYDWEEGWQPARTAAQHTKDGRRRKGILGLRQFRDLRTRRQLHFTFGRWRRTSSNGWQLGPRAWKSSYAAPPKGRGGS